MTLIHHVEERSYRRIDGTPLVKRLEYIKGVHEFQGYTLELYATPLKSGEWRLVRVTVNDSYSAPEDKEVREAFRTILDGWMDELKATLYSMGVERIVLEPNYEKNSTNPKRAYYLWLSYGFIETSNEYGTQTMTYYL